tara:strand:- start:482 stop:823 length:342 start_codon:yes stop_codon:yes gene_type:complete
MSIKQSTNDFKNIQIHLDDRGRLMIDSDLLLENKGDQIQRYTPIEWDDDRCMYHIATLDNIDIEDLFGFLIMRLKELGSWEFLYRISLSKKRLDMDKEIYEEFKEGIGYGGAA